METILYVTNSKTFRVDDVQLIGDIVEKEKKYYQIILVSTYLLGKLQGTNMVKQMDERKIKSIYDLNKSKESLSSVFHNPNIEFKLISCLGTTENILPRIIHKHSVDYVISQENTGGGTEKLIRKIDFNSSPSELSYKLH